uniref:Uncharacterized protein n=1 Tax=Romanomermis culicivorax TaxID=13658 RepID=A0A915L6J9_ROMCU
MQYANCPVNVVVSEEEGIIFSVETCSKDPMSSDCIEYGCQEMKILKNLRGNGCTEQLKRLIIDALERYTF